MKATYVVLVWEGDRPSPRVSRLIEDLVVQGLSCIDDRPGFAILSTKGFVHQRQEDGSVLLGRWRGRLPLSSTQTRSASERAAAYVSNGWGDYVAIIKASDGTFAMRDPSGAGQAHLVSDRGLTMLSDYLTPALVKAAGFHIGINHNALASCLIDPTSASFAPLLNGVVTLAPGRLVSMAQPHSTTTIWSPAVIPGTLNDDGHAIVAAVDSAVDALSGERTLVQLSGGLDSSIVLGTLARLSRESRAVAIVTSAGDVEESHYAAAAAEQANVPLGISNVTAYPVFQRLMDVEATTHPFIYGTDDAFADAVAAVRRSTRADVVMTGQGGDAVFFQPATFHTATDRFRAMGFRSGLAPLLDDARRARTSIWTHVLPALRDIVRPLALPKDELSGGLLSREFRASHTGYIHPWIADATAAPPGRRLQIVMLANSLNCHSRRPTDLGAPLVHPLLTQPVLEAALSYPTWILSSGPIDRGLARRAFADRIPQSVARRASKGEAAAYYSRSAVANLPFLRRHLLEGAMAEAGMIDVDAMARTLTEEHLFYSLDYRALSMHSRCESWLRAWTSQS